MHVHINKKEKERDKKQTQRKTRYNAYRWLKYYYANLHYIFNSEHVYHHSDSDVERRSMKHCDDIVEKTGVYVYYNDETQTRFKRLPTFCQKSFVSSMKSFIPEMYSV